VRRAWARWGGIILAVAAAHAALTAVLRLHGAVDALLFVPDAAIDLLIRMSEVRRWFAGIPIYGDADSANYPPATYALLWPLIGWLGEAPARLLYGMTMLISVVAIAWIGARVSGARSRSAIAFMALLVLPLGATQITVWIGQLGLHVVACLLGAAAILFGTRPADPQAATSDGAAGTATPATSWPADIAAGALLALSLVKPTLSAPIVVAIVLGAGRWRPGVLGAAFYLGATVIAAAFQEASTIGLIVQWLGREDIMNLPLGSVNTHLWLYWLGVEGTMLPASLLWLLALMAWTWRHRTIDRWVVVGVAALVSRLWIHHRAFDDVLLVIPAIVLFRIAAASRGRDDATAVSAALLLALVYGSGHAPYAWLSGESRTLWLVTEIGRTVIWLATLVFLVWHAHRSRRPERDVPPPSRQAAARGHGLPA
jgi:hypothetical protein